MTLLHRRSILGDSLLMWRMMPRLAFATLTATLAFVATSALKANASTISGSTVQSYAYETSGSVSGPSNGPITFNSEYYGGSFSTPGSIVLGSFTTNPLPSTASLTYNNTPFSIDLIVGPVNSPLYIYGYGYGYYGLNPNTYQYQISGVLNGTIGGDGSSSMFATITSITGSGSTPPFPISDLVVSAPQGIAAPPNEFTQGITTLTAQVTLTGVSLGNPTPAPEPTSIAVFGAALGVWALRRRSLSNRRRRELDPATV